MNKKGTLNSEEKNKIERFIKLSKKVSDYKTMDDELYEEFKDYELIFASNDKPFFLKGITKDGRIYEYNGQLLLSLYTGNLELNLPETYASDVIKPYRLDFNFDTLPEKISLLIKLYRDIIHLLNINTTTNLAKGVNCLQDYLTIWLIDNYYLTDAFLEDRRFYLRSEIAKI